MSNDNTKDRPPQVETRGSTIIIDGKEHRKAPPAETQPAKTCKGSGLVLVTKDKEDRMIVTPAVRS